MILRQINTRAPGAKERIRAVFILCLPSDDGYMYIPSTSIAPAATGKTIAIKSVNIPSGQRLKYFFCAYDNQCSGYNCKKSSDVCGVTFVFRHYHHNPLRKTCHSADYHFRKGVPALPARQNPIKVYVAISSKSGCFALSVYVPPTVALFK